MLGKGGLFIYLGMLFFDIAKNYINSIPIGIVGFIDPYYIECYHKTIIPLEVLFLLCS